MVLLAIFRRSVSCDNFFKIRVNCIPVYQPSIVKYKLFQVVVAKVAINFVLCMRATCSISIKSAQRFFQLRMAILRYQLLDSPDNHFQTWLRHVMHARTRVVTVIESISCALKIVTFK